jgi:hypothetical protein
MFVLIIIGGALIADSDMWILSLLGVVFIFMAMFTFTMATGMGFTGEPITDEVQQAAVEYRGSYTVYLNNDTELNEPWGVYLNKGDVIVYRVTDYPWYSIYNDKVELVEIVSLGK